ncbi:unannotated protein [freshwater metagenome]|jgi:hypothetical protein|uniref:Unannotated protein n=1 Tax=freshwater metagenome TaxID=449393 RepID=A0A6J6YBG4_9ZZZZ|nr:hypothetical protein [Actinomycetota bacterium]
MTSYKWQFTPRFRQNAFGWKSDKPIQRIKEALTEIKQIAKKEPALAAEGAVLFLEKIAPAIEQVDSSSGAIGGMVNRAIETLVPIIAKAQVEQLVRDCWLTHLWEAIQNDRMPYIEYLGDYWGDLCVTTDTASRWADEFLPVIEFMWSPQSSGHGYFSGVTPCFSALYSAGRYQDLLTLLDKAPFTMWWNRRWGVKALVSLGKKAEAIRYAEDSKDLNDPVTVIARTCEEILLSSGLSEEAYNCYALAANQSTTYLATFRAIVKKYPHKSASDILRDLVASQPGSEGKWFTAAKDAGLFDLAIELVNKSPTDPRTLVRAARDYAEQQPYFAVSAGLTALYWMSHGYGYQITVTDVLDAYKSLMLAANHAGIAEAQIKTRIQETLGAKTPGNTFMFSALNYPLES